jgi:hypothetical protein
VFHTIVIVTPEDTEKAETSRQNFSNDFKKRTTTLFDRKSISKTLHRICCPVLNHICGSVTFESAMWIPGQTPFTLSIKRRKEVSEISVIVA